MTAQTASISTSFIWRRVHSLMGLWLVLYLFVHLLTNSQAALWIGDDGSGFIAMVNSLESLPYLQVIESLFIGLPLAIHAVWGIQRIFQARTNSSKTDGSRPSIRSPRNRAFTWQRLSSWIVLFGLLYHVIDMRFLDKPTEVKYQNRTWFLAPLTFDEGLTTLAPRLDTQLYRAGAIPPQWGEWKLESDEVLAVAPLPGTAFLLVVRDTFKDLWVCAFYTLFVLAAAFHAFNGFWTSLITWGALLSYRSQRAMIPVSVVGMGLLSFLGLAAIWGSYWINLRN